ncbi:MAG: hypothetical protein QG649_229 [Patescibacteria group bacterium]|nr:hypothetical protein [Patescibacteria group bacterium]
MINLLPDEHKSEIRAARTNVVLVRYIAILIAAAVVLGGLVAGTYVSINGSKAIAQDLVAYNQSLMSKHESKKTQADIFRSDLAIAKSILDNNVNFSRLIYKIADATPPNVILEELPLEPSTFGSSISLKARAKSVEDARKLQESFSKNNQLFSDVEVTNQKIDNTSSRSNSYPVEVTLSVVINKGALQ